MGLHDAIFALHATLGKNKVWVFGEKFRHVEWDGAACAGVLHDVENNHGGGQTGMAGEGGGKTRAAAVVLGGFGEGDSNLKTGFRRRFSQSIADFCVYPLIVFIWACGGVMHGRF
jgi:hypothetical protein